MGDIVVTDSATENTTYAISNITDGSSNATEADTAAAADYYVYSLYDADLDIGHLCSLGDRSLIICDIFLDRHLRVSEETNRCHGTTHFSRRYL